MIKINITTEDGTLIDVITVVSEGEEPEALAKRVRETIELRYQIEED